MEQSMDKREMLIRTLRREGMFQVPCDMFLSPAKEEELANKTKGISAEQYYDLYHRCASVPLEKGYPGDGRQLFTDAPPSEKFSVDPYGVGMAGGSDSAYHMVHFCSPLQGEQITEAQVTDFPLPLVPEYSIKQMEEWVLDARRSGLASAAVMVQTIWERAWLLRGMNDLMMDMASEDARAEILLDRITVHACRLAEIYSRAGFDIIMLGDDIGMQNTAMMSPVMWRRWVKPRLEQVISSIRACRADVLIWYHSCGWIEPFIPDLIEIGIDILNPVQPECMDVEKIFKEYGDKLSFWGGVGTQRVMPQGTPKEIRSTVLSLIRTAGDQGGLVVAPSHMVEPDVPWENIEAFRSAVLEAREMCCTGR